MHNVGGVRKSFGLTRPTQRQGKRDASFLFKEDHVAIFVRSKGDCVKKGVVLLQARWARQTPLHPNVYACSVILGTLEEPQDSWIRAGSLPSPHVHGNGTNPLRKLSSPKSQMVDPS
eukprot:scaffold2318_cov363-Pavlova_lutheri.AAC.11